MEPVKIFIKNMVCDRCKMVVSQELDKVGIVPSSVGLGEVTLAAPPTMQQLEKLNEALIKIGFKLLDDKRLKVVAQIKSLVLELVRGKRSTHENYSVYLAREIGKDYSSLSNLFSAIEQTTIEQYFIHQKIERAKELIIYDEKTISEIASELGYSSVAHLSNQFKKVTGYTPSYFKTIGARRRKPLDQV